MWIRLDPDMSLLRAVEIAQPDYQWQYQLRHERDVTAQVCLSSYLFKYLQFDNKNIYTKRVKLLKLWNGLPLQQRV